MTKVFEGDGAAHNLAVRIVSQFQRVHSIPKLIDDIEKVLLEDERFISEQLKKLVEALRLGDAMAEADNGYQEAKDWVAFRETVKP